MINEANQRLLFAFLIAEKRCGWSNIPNLLDAPAFLAHRQAIAGPD